MPNTVIALKKSSTPSAVPLAANLANGELAINFADGKLFYKNVSGTVVEFNPTTSSNYFGTVNANSTLLVADTTNDVLTIAPGTNINIVGDSVNDRLTISLANDVVIPSTGTFRVAAVGGDEGGEIKLANAITNSVLSGDVIIDVYQNRLRFYESSGTNRGAFINVAAAAAGVGTDLLAGSSGTDTVARTTANAAFATANAALPSSSYTASDVLSKLLTVDGASSGLDADLLDGQHGSFYSTDTKATAAFGQANTARDHANAAFEKANTPSGGAYYSGNNGNVGEASGLGDIFRVHTNTLSANVTIYSGNNALAAGPITVAANRTLTIQANARVAIV